MKFRRNVHLYRGSLDATPLATLFFLLVIFLVLAARMYTPGVHIQLPAADHPMPGSDKSPINVAVDAAGRFYFHDQIIDRQDLKTHLYAAVKSSTEPLVLVVHADKDVTQDKTDVLLALASQAGIREAIFARLPPALGEPVPNKKTREP